MTAAALYKGLFFLLALSWIGLRPSGLFALEKLVIAHGSFGGPQAILQVIQDAGLFEKNGIEIRRVFIPGAPTVLAAVTGGDAQMGVFGGVAPLIARLRGQDTVVILSFIPALDHTVYAQKDIVRVEDLKGKIIGVTSFGSGDYYGARYALTKFGLNPDKDVAYLQLGPQPNRYAALTAGRVHAALFQPPITARLHREGFTRLAWLADLGFEFFASSVFTTQTYIQGNRDTVRRFVKAVVDGIHFYKSNKAESLRSIAKFMKFNDKEALEEAYTMYATKLARPAPYPPLKAAMAVLEAIAKDNPGAKGADPNDFIDTSFVREFEQSGYIKRLYSK